MYSKNRAQYPGLRQDEKKNIANHLITSGKIQFQPQKSGGDTTGSEGVAGNVVDALCCTVSRKLISIILSILFLFGQMSLRILLPVHVNACISAGTDSFLALWFPTIYFPFPFLLVHIVVIRCGGTGSIMPNAPWIVVFIVGALIAVGSLLLTYASDPSRVPPYLMAILPSANIPLLVILRYVFLRKGVSLHRVLCVCGVVVGVVLGSIPQIVGMDQSDEDDPDEESHSLAYRILWPLCYVIAFVPFIFNNILIEKTMKDKKVDSLSLLHWTQWTQLLVIFLLFWTDFIPGFGKASSWDDFLELQWRGIKCHFSSDPSCHGISYLAIMFTAAYSLSTFSNFLLMRYAEGAIYNNIISASTASLLSIFWTLFDFDPKFAWSPHFNTSTAFALGAIYLMVPSVSAYNWFSERDMLREETNEAQSDLLKDCDKDQEHISTVENKQLSKISESPSVETIVSYL